MEEIVSFKRHKASSDIARRYQSRDMSEYLFRVFGMETHGLWQTIVEPHVWPEDVWDIE